MLAHEPLSKLEENGTASILDYNLPQSTTYEVVSLIKLDIPRKSFKDAERKPSPGNYWDRFDAVAETQDLTPGRIHSVLNAQSYSSINEIIGAGLNFTAAELPVWSGVRMQAANMQVSTKSARFATEYAANKIAEGFRPQLYRRPSGKQGLAFQPRPKAARPAMYLVVKIAWPPHLGDYGAGQTLSTFSLLPGEKTVIEIRDYRHNETTQASSESVLDSYSELRWKTCRRRSRRPLRRASNRARPTLIRCPLTPAATPASISASSAWAGRPAAKPPASTPARRR